MIDSMPLHQGSHLVRIVEGVRGSLAMRMTLVLRFDYGSATPLLERNERVIGTVDAVGPTLCATAFSCAAQRRRRNR